MRELIHLDSSSESTLTETLPNAKVCEKLTLFYSMFSDPTRLKIMVCLIFKKMCVNDLATLLKINQTTISHQLKILRSCGAVTAERDSKFVFYKLSNKFIKSAMLSGVEYVLNAS